MTWLQLSADKSDLKAALQETQMLRVTSMSTGLLTVYIDSARGLPVKYLHIFIFTVFFFVIPNM